MECHIRVRELSLSYRWKNYEKSIFNDLNLCIPQGSFTTIIGANGSGKSSLIKLMLGLISPKKGEIMIDGEVVDFGYPRSVREHSIAYLAQRIEELFYADTVLEELSYNQITLNTENRQVFGTLGLDHLLDRVVDSLSGGEKQGLALAQFMMSPATLLLLDEPSSYLDGGRAAILKDYLDQAHKEGKTILHVSQYSAEIGWGTHFIDLSRLLPEVVVL